MSEEYNELQEYLAAAEWLKPENEYVNEEQQ